VDFITKLLLVAEKNAILVVYNKLSKIVHFVAMMEGTLAKELARLFKNNVWKLHKLPESIISDRGPVICKFTRPETTSLQWSHLQNIQACLLWHPPFSQHILWQCCNHLGIPSSTAEILLFKLVFHDGVTPVSVSTLKSLLGVIGVFPLKL